jgi:hypothetical protein
MRPPVADFSTLTPAPCSVRNATSSSKLRGAALGLGAPAPGGTAAVGAAGAAGAAGTGDASGEGAGLVGGAGGELA